MKGKYLRKLGGFILAASLAPGVVAFSELNGTSTTPAWRRVIPNRWTVLSSVGLWIPW